jgi:hypothetical protein
MTRDYTFVTRRLSASGGPMTKQFLSHMVVLFALALAALSAGQRTANAGTNVACFRVLNAAPDAPNLDVYVNRTRVAANLAYTKFSTRLWCYPATEALVRAFVAGANPNTDRPVGQGSVQLMIDQNYTIAVTGYLQQGLTIVALQLPGAPTAGSFSITVFNLAPNVPTVNLVQILLPQNQNLITDVIFPSAKTGEFPPGVYDLALFQPGATAPLFSLGSNTFSAGQKQSVYVFAAPGMNASSAAVAPGTAPAGTSTATVTAIIIRER